MPSPVFCTLLAGQALAEPFRERHDGELTPAKLLTVPFNLRNLLYSISTHSKIYYFFYQIGAWHYIVMI